MNAMKQFVSAFSFFVILFALTTSYGVQGWNDASRMAQIESIVEHGTLFIDDSSFYPRTLDKYFYRGHFYSDKPVILSFITSPFYFLLYKMGISFRTHSALVYYLLTLIMMGIPSAMAMAYLNYFLVVYLKASKLWGWLITLVVGSGTLVWPYSIVYNNHIVSGYLVFAAFITILINKEKLGNGSPIASSLLLSAAASMDITFFGLFPFVFIYFFRKSPRQATLFGLGYIPFALIYLTSNQILSGSFLPPAMNKNLWEYPGSIFNETNLSGLAFHESITGFFVYSANFIARIMFFSPILFFFVLAFQKSLLLSNFPYRTEYCFFLVFSFFYIFVYILSTTNFGGEAFGIRWFSSLVLVLSLPLGYYEKEILSSLFMKKIFYITSTLSIFLSFVGSTMPFKVNDLYFKNWAQFAFSNYIFGLLKIPDAKYQFLNAFRFTLAFFWVFILHYLIMKQIQNQKHVNIDK